MKEILGEVFSINHAPTVFGRNSKNAKPRDIFDSWKFPLEQKNRESTKKVRWFEFYRPNLASM